MRCADIHKLDNGAENSCKGVKMSHKENNLIPTVQYGGGYMIVWGCFSSEGTGTFLGYKAS